MEEDLAELETVIDALYRGLDILAYHVFLGVDESCAGDDLRTAFHTRAADFHPDRFYADADAELRAKVYAVYKRITEAYRVLSDPETRRAYDEQRKEGAVRYVPRERAAAARRPEESLSPAAKRYWTMALDAERRGDLKGAKLNVQLALQLDPDSALLKEKMERLK
jgi:curved DNA-binding protein CbpA